MPQSKKTPSTPDFSLPHFHILQSAFHPHSRVIDLMVSSRPAMRSTLKEPQETHVA